LLLSTAAKRRTRLRFGGGDIAIDLGTANTLVYVRGEGIVLSEPSVIAVNTATGAVHAVGEEARRMIGRTPATISATRPLRHGVIADFDVTERMLRYFIKKVQRSRFAHPRVVMCVPSGVTDVEQRAVNEACVAAGAREVQLVEEPIAAAIGVGLPIAEPRGSMVVDIGGGTSEVAVMSLGSIVVSRSLRIGGYELDEAIMGHLRRRHRVAVGQETAEGIKVAIGSGLSLAQEEEFVLRARDLVSGGPKTIALTSQEVRGALQEPLSAILDAIRETLERTPPELAGDVAERGIHLAGGGSLLKGLDERLRKETGMPTFLAESPLTCVAIGAGQSLEEFDALSRGDGRTTAGVGLSWT
jgi:rod shape-determining protein MreB and related proteins